MRYGLIAVAAIAAILLALLQLEAGRSGLAQSEIRIGETPASVVHRADLDKPAPVVVIAHGFAGSRQLMEPFAFTLARAGYLTVSFDFVGHGAHPAAMPTRIEGAGGAAERLLDQLDAVIAGALAHPLADGRHALLGHSMATDLLAKHAAQGSSRAAATIAVSLLSRDVTATSPRNMLVIVGGYESGLTDEALRVTGLVAGAAAEEGRTYGSFAEGTARRAVFADGVEHIGVLYDPESLAAAAAWLDEAFGRSPVAEAALDRRGPWLGLLFAGLLALALPLSRLLPAIGTEATAGAALPRPTLLALIAGPALLTPLLAVLLPTGLLPIILGDYLAAHFFLYGAVGFAGLWIAARFGPARLPGRCAFSPGLLLGGLAVGAFTILAFGFALERYAFGYWPTAGRAALIPAMLAGV
ncbi:MAG: alpha/beta fold hydrolase, partial [Pseudomonadota bacterium]